MSNFVVFASDGSFFVGRKHYPAKRDWTKDAAKPVTEIDPIKADHIRKVNAPQLPIAPLPPCPRCGSTKLKGAACAKCQYVR
jgi:ribosomal protein L32